jgi:hypothetical protein
VAQLGAQLGGWVDANATTDSETYLRDLLGQVQHFESSLGPLIPFEGSVPSLIVLHTALTQLDQTLAGTQAQLASLDGLRSEQQQACAEGAPAPASATETPSNDQLPADGSGLLCDVGGQAGTSASECFQLETDAAYAVWKTCTEQYFAAEDAAFQSGGDLPVNTCDPAWAATQAAIQQRWGSPSP